ncbi:hypothetical protein ACIQPR_47555 [Streptomyces sp. NPDC091280]|uniref:hypothetical protein n=1 Tax=Streptomyces sp. NPDC091280 TaxID=3365984 RepID=UPI0038270D85
MGTRTPTRRADGRRATSTPISVFPDPAAAMTCALSPSAGIRPPEAAKRPDDAVDGLALMRTQRHIRHPDIFHRRLTGTSA